MTMISVIIHYQDTIFKVCCLLWSSCLLLFFIVLFVFINYKLHYIYLLILNEVLFFLLMIFLISFGYLYDDLHPQIFLLFILVLSSCEVVIGLALIVSFMQTKKTKTKYGTST